MNIAPFHPDPLVVAFFDAVLLPAVAVTAGLALHRLIGRFFAEGDPRRQPIAQVLLYAGAFVLIAVSIWVRHRA